MQEVFGLGKECMLCTLDVKLGYFILSEVMFGGNFGHYNEQIKIVGRGRRCSFSLRDWCTIGSRRALCKITN